LHQLHAIGSSVVIDKHDEIIMSIQLHLVDHTH